jgi:molybdopterin-guanine dinucleotide biosynthesis protein A
LKAPRSTVAKACVICRGLWPFTTSGEALMSSPVPWTAAIIAGGPASRLGGRDKSRLLVGDQSILERQLAALRPVADEIIIVGSHPGRPAPHGLRVVEDRVAGAGALGGIYTALLSASAGRVLAIACDMPFLTARFLGRLAAAGGNADLAIPRPADGYQPLCACYSLACLEPLARRIDAGALRVQDLVADVRTRELGPAELSEYDPDGLLFFNVNTPEDHRRAQRLASRFGGGEILDDGITHGQQGR